MDSVGVQRFAFYEDAGDAYLVEEVRAEWDHVARGEHHVGVAALIGDEEQRGTCGGAELGAEGVVVAVGVAAEIAVGVGEFAAKGDRVARHGLSGEEIDVSLLCQGLRFRRVGDERLHFREGQAVQAVAISVLKRGKWKRAKSECWQKEDREQTAGRDPQPSISKKRFACWGWHDFGWCFSPRQCLCK